MQQLLTLQIHTYTSFFKRLILCVCVCSHMCTHTHVTHAYSVRAGEVESGEAEVQGHP